MTDYARLLVDGHRILPLLLRDIAAAQRSIHVSVFLYFHDPIGDEIARALEERARAGVQVRVLMNIGKTAMGDPFSTGEKEMMDHDPNVDHDPLDVKPLCERLRRSGVHVADTNVDFDAIPSAADERLRSVAAQIRDTTAIDTMHVDHRKIIIIDGRIAYSGGANIGAQYLYHDAFDPKLHAREEGERRKQAGLREPWWKWHDSLTRFCGPVARAIEEHFRSRWILDGGEPYDDDGGWTAESSTLDGVPIGAARVLTNEPDGEPNAIRELYLERILGARRSIFIENPYLYQSAIVEALCKAKAARPELRIDLVVPSREHNDNAFAQDAQEHCYERYLDCGIEVREYSAHFNHLKMAVFDERWSIHGSTNLNYRSLEDDKDFELVVLADDERFARSILADVRDVDLERADRVTADRVRGLSWGALRTRIRDPRTRLLVARRLL